MKKIIYFFAIFTFVLSSCNPLEDINEQIDAQETSISDNITYTLTEDDYTEDVEDGGLGFRFPNFSSVDDVKAELPAFLSNKYAVLGNGSTALITYKLYAPKRTERSLIVYEVTRDDYDAQGLRFPNFSSDDQIFDFLETKYPTPDDRVLVSLTYDFFNGSVNELNDGFFFTEGEWVKVTGLTDDQYAAAGERFPNFSDEEEALSVLPIFLKENFKFSPKVKGDIEPFMYKLFVTDEDDVDGDGRTDDRTTYSYVTYFVYDGADWLPYDNTIEQSIQFGHDGVTWVPDNTIAYTLTTEDFDLIANSELKDVTGYEAAIANLARFGNINRTGSADGDEPSGASSWNDLMVYRALAIVLDNLNPSAADEQKYLVSVSVFNGSSAIEDFALIKEAGEWVKQ